jgi:peptidoglycan hydrolase FlgJ
MSIDPTKSATGAALRQQRNAELKKACKEFESVFAYEMIKSMRQTVDKCDLFSGGEGEEIYESLMDQELAKKMTGYGSNSLAELLYRQMSRIDSTTQAGHNANSQTESASPAKINTTPKAEHVPAPASGTVATQTKIASHPAGQDGHPESEDVSSLAVPVTDPAAPTGTVDLPAKDSKPDWPVKSVLSSKFGFRKDPFTKETKFHAGIDIAAPAGSEVKAAMSGKVLVSRYVEGYGNVVALDNGQGTVTIYAHNEKNLVKAGDQVDKGSLIAKVGSTGRSTGSHLHFEVRKDGKKIDPLAFLGVA